MEPMQCWIIVYVLATITQGHGIRVRTPQYANPIECELARTEVLENKDFTRHKQFMYSECLQKRVFPAPCDDSSRPAPWQPEPSK